MMEQIEKEFIKSFLQKRMKAEGPKPKKPKSFDLNWHTTKVKPKKECEYIFVELKNGYFDFGFFCVERTQTCTLFFVKTLSHGQADFHKNYIKS